MVSKYNEIWTEQSKNSGESMPCGGYDVGANVWVENGELFLYIDRSGSFDENNQMLKLGRFRFSFSKDVFKNTFCQTLNLQKGSTLLNGDNDFSVEIWFETSRPFCHIDIKSNEDIEVLATYESWRFQQREVPQNERMACASYNAYSGYVATYPDNIIANDSGICFYHQNRNDKLLFDFLVDLENLNGVKNKLDNFQKDVVFGGKLTVDNAEYIGNIRGEYAYIPYVGYQLKTKQKKYHNIKIAFNKEQTQSIDKWKENLQKLCDENIPNARNDALSWWSDFWNRSYIEINKAKNSNDKGFEISKNYALFRYMLGCNAYGEYPTKFNGGLFTTDAVFSTSLEHKGKNPDFRRWGGGSFTAQNQRLLYWPMLKSGDFDMMKCQFDYYKRALNNACQRTKEYWEHDGCSFTEQVENLGLPIGWNWGFDKTVDDPIHRRPKWYDPTELISPWIRYYYSSQLEFSYMILKYYDYTGYNISKYIPFIEKSVQFYFEHYEFMNYRSTGHKYGTDGKLYIFPSCALETYRDAVNPIDAIAGLHSVVKKLTHLDKYVDSKKYKKLFARIPNIPTTKIRGKTVFPPAESFREKVGDELPELYTVFPYEFSNVGKNLDIGRETWATRDIGYHTFVSWRQEIIFAARLGLIDEAKDLLIKKFSDSGRKFSAFWGPDHDWNPDCNRGGSAMIGLQEMLLQQYGNNVYILPAWCDDWDVSFKLHIAKGTTITVNYRNSKVEYSIDGDKDKYNIIVCKEREKI